MPYRLTAYHTANESIEGRQTFSNSKDARDTGTMWASQHQNRRVEIFAPHVKSTGSPNRWILQKGKWITTGKFVTPQNPLFLTGAPVPKPKDHD